MFVSLGFRLKDYLSKSLWQKRAFARANILLIIYFRQKNLPTIMSFETPITYPMSKLLFLYSERI